MKPTQQAHAPHTLRVQRRSALHALAAASLLIGLAGCGFALRQGGSMPFRSIALTGFASNSPLATELAQALEASGVDVVETTAQAAAAASAAGADLSGHLIFDARQDAREQVVASTTAFGQVRDFSLRTRLKFRVLRADGSVLLPETELMLARDLSYDEKDALAKQDEIVALHRAMQSDIVAQTLRRLAALRLAAPNTR
jgi:LPS-assembly lipoprotein